MSARPQVTITLGHTRQEQNLGRSPSSVEIFEKCYIKNGASSHENVTNAFAFASAGLGGWKLEGIKSIAAPGRGILAIDELNATCGKRLAPIGLDNTEANRQAYRQLLLTTLGLGEYISGAILFEETLYQSTIDLMVLTAIGNFCIYSIALGMLVEIMVMYPIQERKYRSATTRQRLSLSTNSPSTRPSLRFLSRMWIRKWFYCMLREPVGLRTRMQLMPALLEC